jgi:hypothetical protein
MTPALLTQTTPDDLKQFAWRHMEVEPQHAPWLPDSTVLDAMSKVASYNANADVLPALEGHGSTIWYDESGGPESNTSLRLMLRREARESNKRGRAKASRRGLSNLKLTERHLRQVRRAQLHSADSQVRAAAFDRFQLLRQWEGEVTELEAEHFRAAVVTADRRDRLRREHMRFPKRLVRNADRDALQVGAAFYYCVGRFISHGQTTPGSQLWFRRFPPNHEPITSILSRVEASSRIEWTS